MLMHIVNYMRTAHTLMTTSHNISGFISTGAVAFSRAHFAAGTGTIHMDNVDCTGSETNLIKCSHSTKISCTHLEDAGVRCRG